MTRLNPQSANVTDVVIVGAGPYGLSIAAHLAARGVDFRIFGSPMGVWSNQMPKGMQLKSEGFASSLADPESEFTLAHYCRQEGLAYEDTGRPVPLETFISYGLAFQKRFVANLENKMVTSVRPTTGGFDLELEGGERMVARKVIIAVGISHFAQIPDVLSSLPEGFVSHSSAHSDLEDFRGREVAVVGAGASALDLAALLHDVGASVHLVARKSVIRFHDPPQPRTLADRLLRPMSGLGPGMKLYFYANAPRMFRRLSEEIRLDCVRKTLGPATGWFVRDRVVGKVPFYLGTDISDAGVKNGRVSLQLTDKNGGHQTIEVDHVISATGYRADVQRLDFLSREIRETILVTDKSPTLSSTFESSIPCLYFVGVAAANTFGPLMRFAFGSRFTARHLSRHLAKPVYGKSMLHNEASRVQALERT